MELRRVENICEKKNTETQFSGNGLLFNDISYFTSISRNRRDAYFGKSIELDENPQIVSHNVFSHMLDCTRSGRVIRASSCNSQPGIGNYE